MPKIQTPNVPPLWAHPSPSQINTRPAPPAQQRPPVGPPMPTVQPNDRHPLTGAPIFNRSLPSDNPLPPSPHQPVIPNARNPITGALVYFRPGQDIPLGWEI